MQNRTEHARVRRVEAAYRFANGVTFEIKSG
jgi:hypothetical protein